MTRDPVIDAELGSLQAREVGLSLIDVRAVISSLFNLVPNPHHWECRPQRIPILVFVCVDRGTPCYARTDNLDSGFLVADSPWNNSTVSFPCNHDGDLVGLGLTLARLPPILFSISIPIGI